MIVCPRCSQENEDSAMNCVNCGMNIQWALESRNKVDWNMLLALLLTLAFAVLGLMAVGLFAVAGMMPSFGREQHNTKGFSLLSITGAVVCLSGAVAVLRRKRRPVLLVSSVLLAVLAVIDGLWFFCWQ